MTLTTRDYTMQMGAYEALSLERPIITSDWQILRNSFGPSAVYTNNSSENIKKCVIELLENKEKFLEYARLQKVKRRIYFEDVKQLINRELSFVMSQKSV